MLVDFARELRDERAHRRDRATCSPTARRSRRSTRPTCVDLYWAGRTTLVTRRDQIPSTTGCSGGSSSTAADEPDALRAFTPGSADRRPGRRWRSPRPRARRRSGSGRRPGSAWSPPACRTAAHQGRSPPAPPRSWPRCAGSCGPCGSPRRAAGTRRPPRPRRGRGPTCAAPSARRCARTASRPRCYWRRRRELRHRPLVLILDVSGSMADYSRNLLQFAHTSTAHHARGSRCSASARRLTRITRELERRRPDDALDRAAAGGLRLGGRHPDRRLAGPRSSATGAGAGGAAAGSW